MISRPYDLSISDDEYNKARAWWRNLSNNQMKALEKTHFPHMSTYANKHMIYQMWEEEGKPSPQELIPIKPEFGGK